jgi:hypothetical protein
VQNKLSYKQNMQSISNHIEALKSIQCAIDKVHTMIEAELRRLFKSQSDGEMDQARASDYLDATDCDVDELNQGGAPHADGIEAMEDEFDRSGGCAVGGASSPHAPGVWGKRRARPP